MRIASRALSVVLGTLLGMAVLPPAVAAVDLPARVTVDGRPVVVAVPLTLGDALDRLGVAPERGNLVSVTGRVLRRGVSSGRVTVDGLFAAAATRLTDGAAVALVRGRDVREPVERTLAPAVGVGNPIRTVPAYYGERVYAVRGAISKEVIRESVAPGVTPRAAVSLTFDDGPDPVWTPKILAVLARYRVKATFFATGRNIARYPAVVKMIRAGGHSIQNHSWGHENLGRMKPPAVWRNLIAQIREMRKLRLPFPRWFRPPYGAHSLTTVRIARALGMRTVIWSADPHDFDRSRPIVIARRVMRNVSPGGVILLHDGGGNRANTVAALPMIVEALQRRGYRFVTLD